MNPQMPPRALALNSAHHDAETATWTLALNMAQGDEAPAWIDVLPVGKIQGVDGRGWLNDQPQAVIDATQELGYDLPIDWSHATDLKAPKGGSSPAAGWVDCQSLEVQGGMIRGKAMWNPSGAASVAQREYRYLSPVFHFDPKTKRVRRLLATSLVNRPNLPTLSALNQQETQTMDERLLAALGLSPEATVEQVLTALNAMKTKLTDTETRLQTALNAPQTPDPTQFVPMVQYTAAVQRATTAEANLETARNQPTTPDASEYVPMAQYNQVLTRATEAETALNTQREAEQAAAINQAVDQAIEAGKIAPATRDFYVASCRQEGGLDRFKAFIETAPRDQPRE